jgi:hypothetical protein
MDDFLTLRSELKNEINDFLEPVYENTPDCWLVRTYDEIHVTAQMTPDPNELTRLLGLRIVDDEQIHIYDIYIPESLRQRGYGFGLIDKIRAIANKYECDLYIINMEPTFYNRMIQKGAIIADEDSVLVTQDTQLLQKRSAQ